MYKQLQSNESLHKASNLEYFGFSFKKGGTHTSRTIMLGELEMLLSYVNHPNVLKAEYFHAISEENCLRKQSFKTRLLTFRHLVYLYSLDSSLLLFRALLFFFQEITKRSTISFIRHLEQGTLLSREAFKEYMNYQLSGRFSRATLESTSRNLLSTWTKSGHLSGKSCKYRSFAVATPGSVVYALMLGYLTENRGESLFATEYAQLLDCSKEQAIELAEEASRRGWIVFKRVGTVIEVLFPNLLNLKEQEWIREQS